MRLALCFVLLLSACTQAEDLGFLEGPAGGGTKGVCEGGGHPFLVQEAIDAQDLDWFGCEAPEIWEDGPALVAWQGLPVAIPGGMMELRLQTVDIQDVQGRVLVLDRAGHDMHVRVTVDSPLEGSWIVLRFTLPPETEPGEFLLRIGMLLDFGDGGIAVGPRVEVPVTVLDPGGVRGLRADVRWATDGGTVPAVALSVEEPDGSVLSEQSPESPSGGRYDYGPVGCGEGGAMQSASWPVEAEPLGHYRVTASFVDGCGWDGPLRYALSFTMYDRVIVVFDGVIPPGGQGEGHGPEDMELGTLDLE